MNAGGNAGDIMIPPFSFPQFEPSELQWDLKDTLEPWVMPQGGGEEQK
jgi:hypothetical protein